MKNPGRYNAPKAPEYTLEDFQRTYDLTSVQAVDLFQRFGPHKAELDALLSAMKQREAAGRK